MTEQETIRQFQRTVWEHYRDNRRELPWRNPESDGSFNAYKIMVSELMLQQTQVVRVVPKYLEFLNTFPNVHSLASASLGQVLLHWSGLGYNRRAKYLWQSAGKIVDDFSAVVPRNVSDLTSLPGIGSNTAAAIAVYAYNARLAFVETNIRTVYLHHFFIDKKNVTDKQILNAVELTLPDSQHIRYYRDWYWALMDYGSWLKKNVNNVSRNSAHYIKQTTFNGSNRQIRGKIIRILTAGPKLIEDLENEIDDLRFQDIVQQLQSEEIIIKDASTLRLP